VICMNRERKIPSDKVKRKDNKHEIRSTESQWHG